MQDIGKKDLHLKEKIPLQKVNLGTVNQGSDLDLTVKLSDTFRLKHFQRQFNDMKDTIDTLIKDQSDT
jgi:hypothetical protein